MGFFARRASLLKAVLLVTGLLLVGCHSSAQLETESGKSAAGEPQAGSHEQGRKYSEPGSASSKEPRGKAAKGVLFERSDNSTRAGAAREAVAFHPARKPPSQKQAEPLDQQQRQNRSAPQKPTESKNGARQAASTKQGADQLEPPGPASWASFRNGNQQLGIAGSSLPENLELLWKHPIKHGVPSAVAIVGPHVYAGGLNGKLYCLDRETGQVIWTYRSISDPDAFAPGFKSSPRVTAERVYIGDEQGTMHAVDRITGQPRWRFQADAEIIGCPALIKGTIIFGSYDSYLYCLKASDGSLLWKFQTLDRINCSPAIVEPYAFVAGCDNHLRAINIEAGQQEKNIDLGTYLIASPAVAGEMLYVGTYAAEVLAINWNQEKIRWRFQAERDQPFHASAAVTEKYVLVGGRDKRMHCLNRETGQQVWKFETRGRIDSSPAVAGNRVFFGSADGNIYGLSVDRGEQVWKYNAGGEIAAGAAIGHECLVIGSVGTNGMLYCFAAKGMD